MQRNRSLVKWRATQTIYERNGFFYTFTQRIYSSRQIAKAVPENVMFMWIAGIQRPDFRTFNRFRFERMKDLLEKIFTSVLQFVPAISASGLA
jgi:transposase